MTCHLNTTRALVAAALFSAATAAFAQITGTFTLVSAPLPKAQVYRCTVTNISSTPVTLSKLQIYDGAHLTSALCAFPGLTLAAGASCTAQTDYTPDPGNSYPHCRAQFAASNSRAVLGSLHGSSAEGQAGATAAVVPMQLSDNIALAP